MKWDIEGKGAIVTGAGSGIGRAVAMNLGREGIAVAAVDLDAAKAEATSEEIERGGGRALALAADVSDSARVKAIVAQAQDSFGSIDCLVNIAGYHERRPVQEISDERWQRMLSVHLSGTFYFCRAVLAGMVSRRGGRIVNMSSLHAFGKVPFAAHYSAAKAGIMGLTKALAQEVAPHGVRVNAIAPGPIDTALWRDGLTGAALDERIAKRRQAIPLGIIGRPENASDVILFLLSPASAHLTGQVISVNGGELMP